MAHLVTCLFLPALSLGTGLLYISNGLWCTTRQNQRVSLILDHYIILNPDAQAAEMLWYLVIVLIDVQSCDNNRGKKSGTFIKSGITRHKIE